MIEIEKDLLREYADPNLTEPSGGPDETRRRLLLDGCHAAIERSLQRSGRNACRQHHATTAR
ncbi:MAG: hypothetical protein MZV63_12060 [Marinilabiliales bacterium]|nr:hypothetical protein [Marinilabiliales bacterium]